MEKKILESRVNDVGNFEEKILARSITECFKFEVKILECSFKYVGQFKRIS